jgi:hypothetical protein
LESLKLKLVDISEVDSRSAMVNDSKSQLLESVDLISQSSSELSLLKMKDNPLNQSIITVSRKNTGATVPNSSIGSSFNMDLSLAEILFDGEF